MKRILVLLISCYCVTAIAQTKLIFHKSHGGSSLNYTSSLSSYGPNFGVAPDRFVTRSVLDSVIFVSDTVAVMVTSEYCYENSWQSRMNNNDKPASNESTWKAGRDTVYNHPLFSKRHSLDSIKAVLFSEYYFRNDTDSTKFIGYDNRQPQPVQVEDQLPAESRQRRNEIYLLLVFISGMLVFSLVFSRKVSHAK